MPREFLTPPTLPEANTCRSITIPNDKLWLGIFNSALLDTTYAYNFTQVNATDLTPEETAEICRQIVWDYFESACGGGGECVIPGTDMPPFRIGIGGHIEQLQGGAWIEPEGDYYLPPPPPRTNPSEIDRICLAARNAVNALEQLYEQMLDDYQNDIDPIAAIASMGAKWGVVVLAAAGLVSAGLALIAYGVFTLFYQALEFLTQDMWNEEFSEAFTCILVEIANDTSSVVTFDYDLLLEKLANAQDITQHPQHILLFGQLWYMFQWIGQEGLNLAGATTAITDPDCSYCDGWDFELDMQWLWDISIPEISKHACAGTWDTVGAPGLLFDSGGTWIWRSAQQAPQTFQRISRRWSLTIPEGSTLTSLRYYYNRSIGGNVPDGFIKSSDISGIAVQCGTTFTPSPFGFPTLSLTNTTISCRVGICGNVSGDTNPTQILTVRVQGTGRRPGWPQRP